MKIERRIDLPEYIDKTYHYHSNIQEFAKESPVYLITVLGPVLKGKP